MLFSSIRPHNAVVSCPISGWFKKTLKPTGINTDLFKTHSTISASSSKASVGGAPLVEILKRGHGLIILLGKGFIISVLFRRVMYFSIWCITNQAKINALKRGLENWAPFS